MRATDEWPSFADELTRKSAQTLDRWLERFDRNKITKRELFVLVDALWDCTSGLAHEDFLRTLEAIHKELRDKTKAKAT